MKPIAPLEPASLARTASLRNHLDRGTDGALAEVLARPRTQLVVAHGGSLLVSNGGLHRLVLDPAAGETGPQNADARSDAAAGLPTALGELHGTRIYLGQADGVDFVGLVLDDPSRAQIDSHLEVASSSAAESALSAPATGIDVSEPAWFDLRSLAIQLGDLDVGLACTLVALGNWHRSHPRSPRTGEPTQPVAGGWVRRDPTVGSEHFPRPAPAVIMAVIHTSDDGTERILLGSNAAWPENRYSILAGFVEPGETLERAVVREVYEESGVRCTAPRYLGSQPWPFPCSLMLGFSAEALSDELRPDGDEMSEVRWFTRAELRAAVESGDVQIPGEVSIAGQIVSAWLAGGQ